MNVVNVATRDTVTHTFQEKCDTASKQFAVLLGFVIPISTLATSLVLPCLIITWFLAGNFQEKTHLMFQHPVSRLALLLFSIFIVGVTYSEASGKYIQELLSKMSKLLYIPFLLPLMEEEKWRKRVFFAFVGAMILTLVLGYIKVYAGKLHEAFPSHARLTTGCVFKDHIFTNFMMAIASFIVAHYALIYPKRITRILFWCLFASLVFYVFFISEGRIGYIIFGTLGGVFCCQRISTKKRWVGILGLIFLVGVVGVSSERFQARAVDAINGFKRYWKTGEANSSAGERMEFLAQTWQLSKQHPWFGFGTGSYKEIYSQYAAHHNLKISQNPHNEYLNIFFQLGAVGLIVLLGFFLVIFKYSFYLPMIEQWFVQGILIAMMVGCLGNSWLMDFTSGYLFVLLTATCYGALDIKRLKSV